MFYFVESIHNINTWTSPQFVTFNGETQTYKLNSQSISCKFSLGVNFRASVLTLLFGFAN